MRKARLEYSEVDSNRVPEGRLVAAVIGYIELIALSRGLMLEPYTDLVQMLLRQLEQKPSKMG